MSLLLPADFHRRLAEDGPDAVIFADAEGRIRFWNAAATRIFGFSAEEALGQTLDLIVPERQRARHWEGYNRVMAGGESRYGAGDLLAVPAQRKDGTRISIEFTILPLHDDGGAILGIAAFLRDVTSRFTEMQTLRRQVAELKARP
ncbi:MAG TPA: PAS domain S-box protein [Stellaceae bacterium]|nr:PAS domain S-box protein [Stellaceae bacterium]